MQWVRTYNKQQRKEWLTGKVDETSKPYILKSKWHILHSFRAAERPAWDGKTWDNTIGVTFALTYDGYELEAPGIQVVEGLPRRADFCSYCWAFKNLFEKSVEIEYDPPS